MTSILWLCFEVVFASAKQAPQISNGSRVLNNQICGSVIHKLLPYLVRMFVFFLAHAVNLGTPHDSVVGLLRQGWVPLPHDCTKMHRC